jgi:hypothetical protein
VGIALSDGIVDQLPRHKEAAVARTYDYLYYTVKPGPMITSTTLSIDSWTASPCA